MPMPFLAADDVALVQGLLADNPAAKAAFFTRYAPGRGALGHAPDRARPRLRRHLARGLRARARVGPFAARSAALKPWLLRIATHMRPPHVTHTNTTSVAPLFRRRRGRAPQRPRDRQRSTLEGRQTLRAVYAVLSRIPPDERIAFALRYIDGMELTEVAAACSVSLATTKRRLHRAEKRFSQVGSEPSIARAMGRKRIPMARSLEQLGAARRGRIGRRRAGSDAGHRARSARFSAHRGWARGARELFLGLAAGLGGERRHRGVGRRARLVVYASSGAASRSPSTAPRAWQRAGLPRRRAPRCASISRRARQSAWSRPREPRSRRSAHTGRASRSRAAACTPRSCTRPSSAWKVEAGPFTVSVTGTVFDVNWEPNSQQLVVSVSRGSVLVRDSNTGAERAVRALRDVAHRGVRRIRFELSRSDPPSGALRALRPWRPLPQRARRRRARPRLAATLTQRARDAVPAPSKSDPAASEWREFAKRGALREAFASAEAAGFGRTCASASAAELLLLGDGARLSGKPERAVEALLTLRRRYPGDRAARGRGLRARQSGVRSARRNTNRRPSGFRLRFVSNRAARSRGKHQAG